MLACLAAAAALAAPAEAAFPGANGKIVFGSNGDIYTMNADGSAVVQLTSDGAYDVQPAWSPDGQRIAFVRLVSSNNSEVYVMNSDGSGVQALTSNPAMDTDPSWSPDGARIAFRTTRNGTNGEIYAMNADGSSPVNLTSDPDPDLDPAWSPDGQRIAFIGDHPPQDSRPEVYVMNADGSAETRLSDTPFSGCNYDPNWSPDGGKIVFKSCGDDENFANSGFYVINVDGSGQQRTVSLDEGVGTKPVWSPDGKRFVFSGCPNGPPCGIWLINPDGTSPSYLGVAGDDPDWQRLPAAPYARPASATPLSVSLVPLFRQCGTGATPVNGQHSPPLGTGSCNPPSPNSIVARVGASSTGSAQFTVVPGDTDASNGDQADVSIASHLSDVITPAGADYNPNPSGADLTEVVRLRLTDRRNNYGGASGTTTDLDFAAPIDCISTAGPAGATCDAATSADALVAGTIEEDRGTVAQVFRVRVYDSGANGVRENGTGDDRIFAHQGIYIP